MQNKIIKKAKEVHGKAKTHAVIPMPERSPYTYRVISGTSGHVYFVALSPNHAGATCSCPWGQYRPMDDARSGCSHAQAVIAYLEAEKDRSTSAWNEQTQAERQHRPIINLGDGVVVTSRRNGT